MAEFHFYSLRSDWINLLDAVLSEHNVRFATNRWYGSDNCDYYSSVCGVTEDTLSHGRQRVFLLGDFSEHPLVLQKQDGGERSGQFWVNPKRGGPAIELDFPACYEDQGRICLSSGLLHLYREYDSPDGCGSSAPGAAIRLAYREIRSTLLKRLTAIRVPQRVHISEAAADTIRRGQAELSVRGRWRGVNDILA